MERRWSEGWKKRLIVLIVEKGERDRVEEYRGVTITSMYKMYAEVLEERLRKKVEERRIIIIKYISQNY